MPTLEEITYDAARDALREQEAEVAGIRQRTGTLLAAHALVASFLGSPVLRAEGLVPLTWVGLAALVGGLLLAGALLAPWNIRFTLDAVALYDALREKAAAQSEGETSAWLVTAAYLYLELRALNAPKVSVLSRCSMTLIALMVVQTLAWLLVLAVA